MKIMLDIDGTSIQVEIPDVESGEAILKLVQRMQAIHPGVTKKVTT
jgi:hypothetical protein